MIFVTKKGLGKEYALACIDWLDTAITVPDVQKS